jgi:hypothetical protein
MPSRSGPLAWSPVVSRGELAFLDITFRVMSNGPSSFDGAVNAGDRRLQGGEESETRAQ